MAKKASVEPTKKATAVTKKAAVTKVAVVVKKTALTPRPVGVKEAVATSKAVASKKVPVVAKKAVVVVKDPIVIPRYCPVVFERSGGQVVDELNKRLATIHELLAQIVAELSKGG